MPVERARLIADIIDGVQRATERATSMNHAAAARIGVNATDLRCAQLLGLYGTLTAGELARLTGLTTASVTGIIDRLENAGLAQRTRDPADRRRVVVELQRDQVMADVFPVFAPVTGRWRKALADYDEPTLEAIATFLRQVATDLDAEINTLRSPEKPTPLRPNDRR